MNNDLLVYRKNLTSIDFNDTTHFQYLVSSLQESIEKIANNIDQLSQDQHSNSDNSITLMASGFIAGALITSILVSMHRNKVIKVLKKVLI